MRFAYLPLLLVASIAAGQEAENVTPKPPVVLNSASVADPAVSNAAAKIAADTPVMVIAGFCEGTAKDAKEKTSANCKTVVTRAQFDALADAIQPNMDAISKAQLAASYPKLLAMQREFQRRALANDAQVKLALQFAKMRAEADEAEKALKAKSADVSEAEIKTYYEQNAGLYQESELKRLYVPFTQSNQPTAVRHGRPEPARKPEDTAKPANDPMTATAEAIRARAAAGEDFDSLQAEVFRDAGMLATPPDSNMGKRMASEMSPDRRQVVAMAVGEVSQVLNGPNGYYIYKVVSKDIRPLDQVRAEIKSTVADRKFAELKENVNHSVKTQFNTAYFPKDPLTVSAPATSAALNFGSQATPRTAPGNRPRRAMAPQLLMPGASRMTGAVPNSGVVTAR